MIRYICMRSKADAMASLIWRMAQKWKNKEKLKPKTKQLRRNGPGNSPWRQCLFVYGSGFGEMIWYKGSNAPFPRSPMVDKVRTSLEGDLSWLSSVLRASFSVLTLVVGWSTSAGLQKIWATCPQSLSFVTKWSKETNGELANPGSVGWWPTLKQRPVVVLMVVGLNVCLMATSNMQYIAG